MRYILIILLFLACKNNSKDRKTTVKFSDEKLDTVNFKPAINKIDPQIFETAFIKGTIEKGYSDDIYLYAVNIGKLKVSSGKIIATDPTLLIEYNKPFIRTFPTGEFPVQLSIAKIDKEETIAFARLLFSEEPVVKWELALKPGDDTKKMIDNDPPGYVADAGVGSFMDEAAFKAIEPKRISSLNAEPYKQMDNHRHLLWRYTMYPAGDHNIALFSSGVGDGYYSTYIGYDAKGQPCRLVTDFNVIKWSEK